MTNEQIIADIAMTIYGEDTVLQMLEDGIEIPLHTVKGWAARGPYKIKKNEHGIECKLWKKKKKTPYSENKEIDTSKDNEISTSEEKPTNRDFYLCKSFLFRADQVEKIKK